MATSIKQKMARAAFAVGSVAALAPVAFATPAIENDTLEGLPSVGSDLGSFLSNLAPGLGTFLLIVGIFVGVIGIIGGIAYFVTKLATKMKFK